MTFQQQVERLAVRGIRPREIALRLNCGRRKVYRALEIAREKGAGVPTFMTNGAMASGRLTVSLSPEAASRLREKADALGLTPAALATSLLDRKIAAWPDQGPAHDIPTRGVQE
ncbi:hypothetical protein T8T21_00820 [Limimaricola variabilis]|uniref:hypothetical protein n=1 Tax=Limimaricola variabilis TaxID=1492771 RepID=UPI002AC8B51C|nr:hypothetical protein [Limimaricola variabilis]WPY94701.1 hypothetical protein T8T21_00820 [Limimaricola variabilis]